MELVEKSTTGSRMRAFRQELTVQLDWDIARYQQQRARGSFPAVRALGNNGGNHLHKDPTVVAPELNARKQT
ncbi:hypothetical protein PR003_g18958 [Phytophthora rubi]|uniref:Uncharacterized protein n=1 Tax=Phytophthora rubi TaxID=129364 RepID=A0A6A3KVP1_9STRA|nr:hypothetical protein PR001_g15927 [Phytophthora rubi]KAE9023892.1 hypothetical protein PR002_g11598 [Phytophthora rubi]KAE9315554.1 hypothetical protein PR003_g18958 [Phytophthora rubi]